jgi:hypothetical protein
LIAVHGADCPMPSLLDKLAAPGCPNIGHGWGRCHVHYVEPIENHPSHPNSFTSSRLNLIQPELGRRRCYGRFRVPGPCCEAKRRATGDACGW